MKKVLLSSALALSFTMGALMAPSISLADKVTWQQRKELFVKGTITDSQGKTWNVLYLPGADKINNVSKESFNMSWDLLKEMGTKEFWKERLDEVQDGWSIAKEATQDYWIKGVKKDYKTAKEKAASIKKGDFGALPSRTATWTKFGIKAVGRTVTFPLGVAYGVGIQSTAIPLVSILGYPLMSTTVAAGGGVVVPGVMYAWNGAAWVGTSLSSNEPTSENYFIRIKYGQEEKKDMVIDKKGFDTLLISSAVESMSKEEIAKIQVQIDELVKQRQALEEQKDAKYSDLYANESYKLFEKMLSDSWYAKSVTLDQASKEVLVDDAKLTELVKAFLVELGVEPSEQRVASVKATLQKNLEKLLREMATTVVAPKA